MSLAPNAADVKSFLVHVPVRTNDPLFQLKESLDWAALREEFCRALVADGRRIDPSLPGRRTDVDLWLPLVVLAVALGKTSREMDELMGDSARARVFVGISDQEKWQIRDHSSFHRMMASLARSKGLVDINKRLIDQAVALGLTDGETLSANTTAQQANIPYPNEPNILAMAARSALAATKRLGQQGRKKLGLVMTRAKQLIAKAKEYHLFAKGKEAKTATLNTMLRHSTSLKSGIAVICKRLSDATSRAECGALNTLRQVEEGLTVLLPQIHQWMATGIVAKGKLLHIGMPFLRSIVRNKPGRTCEFGIKQLLVLLKNGFLLSGEVHANSSEADMPACALELYSRQFGRNAAPERFTYDRGGWSEENVRLLRAKGVKKIGLQPKGRARYRVHGLDRTIMLQERSRTEGVIGTLKQSYKMDRPRERRPEMFRATTPRAVLAFNLNKVMNLRAAEQRV
jgi:hypothetical protein